MSAIWTIATKDLKNFVSSPKGATVFFFFLFFLGLFFNYYIGVFVQGQMQAAQAGGNGPTLEMLMRALFSNIHFILFLTIPAVTMATFAGERRTQSIRLLLNAPISSNQIVIGKFLAMALFMAIVLIASCAYPMFTTVYGNPDKGVLISAYIGVFLLMLSQVSFGMWVSSIMSNQFLAFMFTILGLFLFLIVGWLVDNQLATGSMQSALKYLASTEHLDTFLKGTITVQSITYFIALTATFLYLTILSIESLRWR